MKKSTTNRGIALVRNKLKRDFQIYLIILPAVIFYFVFSYIPLYGITLAFREYRFDKGILYSPWIGLRYFMLFFNYYDLWNLIRNTLVISFFKIVLYFPFPIILALLINEVKCRPFKKITQTLSYLPNFISWAAAIVVIQQFLSLDGIVNSYREGLGLKAIFFMSDVEWFYSNMFISYIWKNAGMGSIIYLAAISGIDPNIYESAIMDGCSRLKRVWYITIPQILPTATVLFILSLSSVLSAGWDQIYLLRTPGNMELANILDTYVLDVGLTQGQFSYATAVSLIQGLVGFFMIVVTNKFAKKITNVSIF